MSSSSATESSAPSEAHGHTNYVKIWVILMVLLVISILGPLLGVKVVTLITAFGIGVVKAVMVAAYFMHLNVEKRYIWYLLLLMLIFLGVLFFGLAPDVMKDSGRNWINPDPPAVVEGAQAPGASE